MLKLRVPTPLIVLCAIAFEIVNAVVDYQLGGARRSFSLYAFPVFFLSLLIGYHQCLLFTAFTSILYIVAGHHEHVALTVAEAVDVIFLFLITTLMSKLMSEHRSIQQVAIHDPLTGLYNRAFMFNEMQREIERSHRYGRAMSLLMVDIDHFKQYNDTYGHQQGDVVLRETAFALRSKVRTTDIVGRYGGEEFAIILPETNLSQARLVADRLRTYIGEHTAAHRGLMTTIHISVGVATCTPGTQTSETLVEQADHALYEAKHRGRNQVVVYTPGMGDSPEDSATGKNREPVERDS